jgi:hypothetical protein
MTNVVTGEQRIEKSSSTSGVPRVLIGMFFVITWLISSAFPVILFYTGIASMFWMAAFLPYAVTWSALICLKWYCEITGFTSESSSSLTKAITHAKNGSFVILLAACYLCGFR